MKNIKRTNILFLFVASLLISFFIFSNLNFNKVEKDLPEESGAKKALDFWTRLRAYPDNDIPSNKFMKAYHDTKSKLNNTLQNIS